MIVVISTWGSNGDFNVSNRSNERKRLAKWVSEVMSIVWMNWMDLDMDNWRVLGLNNIIVLDSIFVLVMARFLIRRIMPMKFMFGQRIMIEHWCLLNRISLVFIRYSMFQQRKYLFNPFLFILNQLTKISYVNFHDKMKCSMSYSFSYSLSINVHDMIKLKMKFIKQMNSKQRMNTIEYVFERTSSFDRCFFRIVILWSITTLDEYE